MTDHFDPLDELASAHLDGHTTPEEAARVEADPRLRARVDELRAVQARLRADTGPVDPARRDATIAAALAAFDERPAVVTDLGDAKRRRTARRARVVGVAAAVVLAAALVPAIAGLGDDDPADDLAQDEVTTADAPLDLEQEGGRTHADGPSSTTFGAAPGIAEMDTMLAAPFDLGPHLDLASLRASVATALVTPPPPGPAPLRPEAEACAQSERDRVTGTGGTILLEGSATLEGRLVVLTVTEDEVGIRSLRVVDPAAGCAVVADEAI